MNPKEQFEKLKQDAQTYFDLNGDEKRLLLVMLDRAYTLGQLQEVNAAIERLRKG